MHSDSHRLVNQIRVCCPSVRGKEALSSDYAHIPLPGAALIDPVHIQVKLNAVERFTVQVLKSSDTQVSLSKIERALKDQGVKGDIEANSSFLRNLGEQFTLRLPLSTAQSHLTLVDERMLADGIEKFIMSDDECSYELSRQDMEALFLSHERTKIADVSINEWMSVKLQGNEQTHEFDSSFSVVNHCYDAALSSKFKDQDESLSNIPFNPFFSCRAYDELSMLYECADSECFLSGFKELLHVFPAIQIEFLDKFYGMTEDPESCACMPISEMVDVVGASVLADWIRERFLSVDRRSEPMVKTLTFLHQADFSLMNDAVERLCNLLESNGKLKELSINRALLGRMVAMAFYAQHVGYRMASGEQLGKYLEHILLNSQFDLSSLMEGFFSIEQDAMIQHFMSKSNYPVLIQQCVQGFRKGLSDHPSIRYVHIISCLFSMFARKGKLNVRMADASTSQLTDYMLDKYDIREEVEAVVKTAKGIQVFDKPDIAKEIESKRARIDLSFYRVV